MFTGIVQGTATIAEVSGPKTKRRFVVQFPEGSLENLTIGASIALNGVCLTVVEFEGDQAAFDVIDETLDRSSLGCLEKGDFVNYERAAKMSDEIGGHLLSGHIMDTAQIVQIDRKEDGNVAIALQVSRPLLKYIFSKGYVGLDGTSLTIGEVDGEELLFWIHLIPETLRVTTWAAAEVGDIINVEVDAMTQAAVDTVERVLAARK